MPRAGPSGPCCMGNPCRQKWTAIAAGRSAVTKIGRSPGGFAMPSKADPLPLVLPTIKRPPHHSLAASASWCTRWWESPSTRAASRALSLRPPPRSTRTARRAAIEARLSSRSAFFRSVAYARIAFVALLGSRTSSTILAVRALLTNNSNASAIRRRASSIVRPCVWQPRTPRTEATHHPEASRSYTT